MPACSGSAGAPEAPAPQVLEAAAGALAAGGIAVYPTETLYALGADAGNAAALQRLLALKVRAPGKPIAVLVSDRAMLDTLVYAIPPAAEELMRRFWPGPLTLVLPARPAVSAVLTGGGPGIGVRLSSHPVATALVAALGRPLTTPSANPAGAVPPRRLAAARAYFGASVDAYVDGGTLPGEPASTVVDVCAGELRIVREGAIAAAAVQGRSVPDLARCGEPTASAPAEPTGRAHPPGVPGAD